MSGNGKSAVRPVRSSVFPVPSIVIKKRFLVLSELHQHQCQILSRMSYFGISRPRRHFNLQGKAQTAAKYQSWPRYASQIGKKEEEAILFHVISFVF